MLVGSAALADIPPPLWASRCASVEGCSRCFAGDGDATCAADAKAQGFEYVCSHHRTEIYCPPGRATAARVLGSLVPAASALTVLAVIGGAGLFVRRQRTRAVPPAPR